MTRSAAQPFDLITMGRVGVGLYPGQIGVRLTLHDEGNDDRAVSCAAAVLAPTEG